MNDKERDENSEGIKVSDKRRFNPDGSGRDSEEAPRVEGEETSPLKSEDLKEAKPTASQEPTEIKFADLILSFAGSAQMQLGLAPNPFSSQVEKNLGQAKQTIDLLGMLAQKTRGNLTQQEDQLLQVILTDLRLRYIEEKKKS